MIFPVKEVAAHIQKCIKRYRISSNVSLNSADWDDIAQDILIHVYIKWPKQTGEKWHKWVGCITRNQILNKVRDRITAYRQMPLVRLRTRVHQLDDMGQPISLLERDIVKPQNERIDLAVNLIEELPHSSQNLAQALIVRQNWQSARRLLSWSQRRLAREKRELLNQLKELI